MRILEREAAPSAHFMSSAPEGLRPAAAHWPVIGPRDQETRALIGRESGVGQLQRCTDIADTRLQNSDYKKDSHFPGCMDFFLVRICNKKPILYMVSQKG